MTHRKFQFVESSVEYGNRWVLRAKIPISRYGKYVANVEFTRPLTEREAIQEVNAYLSEPLSRKTFDRIKDDLFDSNPQDYVGKEIGKVLGDAIFLEGVSVSRDGTMTLRLGS